MEAQGGDPGVWTDAGRPAPRAACASEVTVRSGRVRAGHRRPRRWARRPAGWAPAGCTPTSPWTRSPASSSLAKVGAGSRPRGAPGDRPRARRLGGRARPRAGRRRPTRRAGARPRRRGRAGRRAGRCRSSPRSRPSGASSPSGCRGGPSTASRSRTRCWSAPEDPEAFATGSRGRRIDAVGRRGKYLLVELDSATPWPMHLRMTGRLHWRAGAPPAARGALPAGALRPGRRQHADLRRHAPLRAGLDRAGDARGPRGYWAARAGIEPLSPRFTARRARRAARGAAGADQGRAAEPDARRRAREHVRRRGALPGRRPPAAPRRRARRRPRSRACTARSASACGPGWTAGGASIDRYRDSLGERGTMQDLLRVHLHAGEPCLRCGTTIVKTRVAGRGTYWCPRCQPAPADLVTDVPGSASATGPTPGAAPGARWCSRPPGTVGAVDVRGGGPATRETDLLAPLARVHEVTAMLLTGGSAFGLDAAAGVVRWCEEQGLGHDIGRRARARSCPPPCIFDLGVSGGGRAPGAGRRLRGVRRGRRGPARGRERRRGDRRHRRQAARRRRGGARAGSGPPPCGCTTGSRGGAGRGERVGRRARRAGRGDRGRVGPGRGFLGASPAVLEAPPEHPRLAAPGNTTLGVVVTDGRLAKAEAANVARMALGRRGRAVSPVHTPARRRRGLRLATGARPASRSCAAWRAPRRWRDAIRDAVRSATAVRGVPTAAERVASRAE